MHRIPAMIAVSIGLAGLSLNAATTVNLDACAAHEGHAERRACFEQQLGDRPIGRSTLASIARLVTTRPESVVEIAALVEKRREQPDVSGAALLDLKGQALLELGRADQAAAAFDRALAVDEGSEFLSWFSTGLQPRWTAPLDAGDGRMIRAARAYLAAGRADDAARWLERGVSLGADPGPREAWSALADRIPAEDPATPMTALDWFAPLPDVEVPLIDGGGIRLGDERGKVLLLNFWATWCEPCVRELGHLQYLYESERERGFEMIAVNTEEPLQLVVPYVKELGLTMPIGVYDRDRHDVFDITQLPSVIVADRQGRIRGRWAGYEDGRESELTDVIRLLLEESPPSREVGRIRRGAGLIEVEWTRDVRARIAGMELVESVDGPRILASQGELLPVFRPDGSTEQRIEATSRAGQLRAASPDADGRYWLFGFRPGGTGVVVFSMPEASYEIWEAPSPVLSLQPFDTSEGTVLLLGTLQGLHRADPQGKDLRRVGDFGLVSGLAVVDSGLAVLEGGGGLSWIDRSWNVVRNGKAGVNGWHLLPSTVGLGVASAGVNAVVEGRFVDGGARQVAAATRRGQLVLLDLDSGRVLARLEIAEIVDLVAGDLDGDGLDELIVAAGNRLILLSGKPSSAALSGAG